MKTFLAAQTNLILTLMVGSVGLMAGCNNKSVTASIPEVNDINCQFEVIKKIEDKATRETFAGLCLRRSTSILPPAKPMNW